jgi:hypothetical protein
MAWELAYGPIPPGLHVLHRCDNKPCCNPAHLFLGTKADNHADMMTKGRHGNARKAVCLRGHRLSGDNLFVTSNGRRQCRTCKQAREFRYRQARRAAQALAS